MDARREEDGKKIQQRRLGFGEERERGTGKGRTKKGREEATLPLPLHGKEADPP
jgi:hypothetical protein